MPSRADRAAEWVYRGLWRILSGWFRVPEEPPALPHDRGSPVRAFHPSRGFLRYLKFYFWIGLLAVDALLIAVWAALGITLPLAGALLSPVFLVLIIVPDVVAYIAIHLRYDTTWYVMSDTTLRCRRGVWLICEHTITFENVQDIRVRRGPVQQLFGISSIVIETAGASEGEGDNAFAVGNKAVMEGIDNPDEIRGLILDRVRRSRSAGLGDEADERGWGRAEVDLLREIREELRGIAPAG